MDILHRPSTNPQMLENTGSSGI